MPHLVGLNGLPLVPRPPDPELIDVHVCVFPDGTTYWMESATSDKVAAVFAKWNADNMGNPLFKGSSGGVVVVKMPRSKYNSVPAVGTFLNLN